MNNKLRSVIEDINTANRTVSQYDLKVGKFAMENLLDAIIEDMQEYVKNLRNMSIGLQDFDRGMIGALENRITILKQAREELSTSLTQ